MPTTPAPAPTTTTSGFPAGTLQVTADNRPAITPAQIVSGIPIVAEALHTFGVFNLSQAQQDSLSKLVLWSVALVGGDAVIRFGRNLARRL
jgi:hypothetical protein